MLVFILPFVHFTLKSVIQGIARAVELSLSDNLLMFVMAGIKLNTYYNYYLEKKKHKQRYMMTKQIETLSLRVAEQELLII